MHSKVCLPLALKADTISVSQIARIHLHFAPEEDLLLSSKAVSSTNTLEKIVQDKGFKVLA